MKKLFTLFAAAAMTMSVSAEVIYSWESEGPDAVSQVGGVATAKVDEARVNYSNEVNGKTYYTICLSGKLGTYPESAYVNVTLDQPLAAGDVISVTAYRNKNATGKNATVAFLFGGDKNNSSELKEQFPNINPEGENDPAPGTQTIVVPESAAGMTSFDMTRGSAGTNIFITNLTITREGGETPEEPSGETRTMTLSGSWPQGEFGSIETPFEMDFDTMTLTLKNFLGAKGDAVCKVEQRDPNAVPTVGTMFNIIPEAGFTETGDLYGDKTYSIDGLSSSVIFTADGVNTVKLDNPNVIFTNYSSVELATGKQYNFVIYLFGNYSQWDSAANAWGEVSSMPGYFELKTTVSGDETSAIENIEVEAADENAPVEYFNIQGMRVENPAAGQLLIRRQGSKVSKVIIR